MVPKGIVLTPDSDGYEASLQRWSQTCVKRAAVVVKPTNANEVSAAVTFATSHKLPFAVKGGGHATSGVSACEDGMAIDLDLLRGVSVDPETKLVSIGGGCRWTDVNEELWKHGLATVGGTVADTGVGGLILGGGMGFLTPQYGLCTDLLVEAEVVTADGKIRVVSDKDGVSEEDKDLFWALRGAGQNFGVVTRFTTQAFPQGHVYSGSVVVGLDQLDAVVDFSNVMIERQDERSTLVFAVTHLPHGEELVAGVLCIVFYNGSEEEGRRFFAPLLAVATVDMTKEMPWPETNVQLGQVGEESKWRRLQGGSTFVPPLQADTVRKAVVDEFLPFAASQPGMKNPITMILYEILPNKKVRSVPHTATAFAARDNIYHISTLFQWEDPALDMTVRHFNRKMIRMLRELGGIKDGVTQYNNYDTAGPISPEHVFGVNLERLRAIKARLDPDNVFFKWLSLYPRPAAPGDDEQPL
ncbi:uncharacterized protein B0I36DRAFT_246817 [Microdochium trichocladiopsis]|uniref:FAD-binding PCMH-type domain-containing protein n=1 Tax=Microdochium trichocladiopsis TaxID=1682393 RepID=A0A9P8Y5P8_9PEZI|nr:uncharacterized protein B0I36DRAFT_246817 [Microdochium trichocladiopsis]KAH7028115.1 hypothetical protein B0I36DRAFT_246817 [Microdochium trichocladiopsis]